MKRQTKRLTVTVAGKGLGPSLTCSNSKDTSTRQWDHAIHGTEKVAHSRKDERISISMLAMLYTA